MRTDPIEEWRRLTEHYRALTDEQLEELAFDLADLTPAAQQVLRGEMRSRGLRDPEAPSQVSKQSDDLVVPQRDPSSGIGEESGFPHEYTWKTLLCQCSTRAEAAQISELLRRAGIESWVDAPASYSPYAELDLANPRILIAADELDQARSLVSMPMPQDILDASAETVPEFEVPHCPACGAADSVLEGVEPVNSWRCEFCGKQWMESELKPVSEPQRNPA